MGWDDVLQQARGKDMLTLEGCVEWSHPEKTRRETLLAELARLRAVEAAALALRARVRDWGAVPFLGPGHEEAYELATNAAEDAILVAASAFDAALASAGDEPR